MFNTTRYDKQQTDMKFADNSKQVQLLKQG